MARFALVAIIFQIILNPCIVWKVHYCGKKSWETFFGEKQQHVITEADSFFKNETVLIDFKCSQLKSLLKCGYFFLETIR